MANDDNSKQYRLQDKQLETIYSTLGKHIAEARRTQGISQEVLAAMADIDRSHMGFIEQGRRNPTITTLFKICRALKIELHDLFKGL